MKTIELHYISNDPSLRLKAETSCVYNLLGQITFYLLISFLASSFVCKCFLYTAEIFCVSLWHSAHILTTSIGACEQLQKFWKHGTVHSSNFWEQFEKMPSFQQILNKLNEPYSILLCRVYEYSIFNVYLSTQLACATC